MPLLNWQSKQLYSMYREVIGYFGNLRPVARSTSMVPDPGATPWGCKTPSKYNEISRYFLSLDENTLFFYKHTDFSASLEYAYFFDDLRLKICLAYAYFCQL